MLDRIFVKLLNGAKSFGHKFRAFILKDEINPMDGNFAQEMWFNMIDEIIVKLEHTDRARTVVRSLD